MKKLLPGTAFALIGFVSPLWAEPPQQANPPAQAQSATAAQSEALPTPLPAEMFQGKVRDAYKAAAEIPEVLATVKCYCGCDKSQGHRNLLDCFADDHGAG